MVDFQLLPSRPESQTFDRKSIRIAPNDFAIGITDTEKLIDVDRMHRQSEEDIGIYVQKYSKIEVCSQPHPHQAAIGK